MIKLFDLNNGVVVPTEHCYILKDLKAVMDAYPDNYMNVYLFLFYMTYPNPEMNPFFDTKEHDREEAILAQITVDFSLEDEVVLKALALCKQLYETPTYRAYMGIKGVLDKLAEYMEKTNITDGRDGNITAIVNTAKNFEGIRMSFRGAYKDLMEEQKSSVRGGQNLAYDQ
jgi:hypothetical protein